MHVNMYIQYISIYIYISFPYVLLRAMVGLMVCHVGNPLPVVVVFLNLGFLAQEAYSSNPNLACQKANLLKELPPVLQHEIDFAKNLQHLQHLSCSLGCACSKTGVMSYDSLNSHD